VILFWTAVAAVAASLSALMAAIDTWLTYRLVRGQGEPKVVDAESGAQRAAVSVQARTRDRDRGDSARCARAHP